MKDYSAFDILGPIMVGPSSSHTAGAARIAKAAREITGVKIKQVEFHLHGSFAKTYKGHGTDKALVAGILGMNPDNPKLKNSFSIAHQRGVKFIFDEINIDGAHPNTVKIDIWTEDGKKNEIIGSSIGGGNIVISQINGLDLKFTGQYPTIITRHIDKPGVISKVTTILAKDQVNVANMNVYRYSKGSLAAMIIEVDHEIEQETIKHIENIPEILNATFINN